MSTHDKKYDPRLVSRAWRQLRESESDSRHIRPVIIDRRAIINGASRLRALTEK